MPGFVVARASGRSRCAVSTDPPLPGLASKSVGGASSCLGFRFSGVDVRLSCCRRRVTGESASTALQPGSAAAGFRMKRSSQISRSTSSGVVSDASSGWMRPDSDTTIAS